MSILEKCSAGGIACGISGFLTNPSDVIKIRNQQFGGEKYGSFFKTFKNILSEEGLRGFLKGAKPTVIRELTYSSFRMGMYEPIKSTILVISGPNHSENENSPIIKWGGAFLSGGLGSALFNPIDLVKVRFQSNLPNQPMPYNNGSVLNALTTIYKEEGFRYGLYRGSSATIIRAALLTAGQLGSYDVFKNNLLVSKMNFSRENFSTHFCSSLLASLVATTVCNPADVIKTRMMNDQTSKKASFINFTIKLVKNERFNALMKGWTASYFRIGPHTVISFILVEQIRKMIGMATY